MRKKTILAYICNGISDCEFSCMLSFFNGESKYHIKTIASDKEVKKSKLGITILPDLDFIPKVDLKDMDTSAIAMLILPEADINDNDQHLIMLLTDHCIEQNIPVINWSEFKRRTAHDYFPVQDFQPHEV